MSTQVPTRRTLLGVLVPMLLIPTAAQAQLRVAELWTSKGDLHSPLIGVGDLYEDSRGVVWITDPRAASLYRFTPGTGEYERVGRRGDGPGEFKGPIHLAGTTGGGVAVHDLSRRAIEVFDGTGAFVRRVSLGFQILNPKDFKILPDGRFVITGGSPVPDNQGAIHIFSVEGEHLVSLGAVPDTRNPRAGNLVGGGALAAIEGERLLYSNAAPFEIDVVTLGSQPRLEVLCSDDEFIPPMGDEFIMRDTVNGMLRTRFRWSFPRSELVAVLESGDILNVAVWRHDGYSVWDRIDRTSGQLLQRTKIPKPYIPHFVTDDGHVLAEYRDSVTNEAIVTKLELQW